MGIFTSLNNTSYNDWDDDYEPYTCVHGIQTRSECCDDCDAYESSRGGIDKCMNCGRYKYNDQMTYPGQVCKSGCVNPNEY